MLDAAEDLDIGGMGLGAKDERQSKDGGAHGLFPKKEGQFSLASWHKT